MSAVVDPSEGKAWDAFVQASDPGSYLQLGAWADVKRRNGWTARQVLAAAPGGPIGAQILIRQPRPMPWAFAYAPRGPITANWRPDAIRPFTVAARDVLRQAGRISHLRIDPEVEIDGPFDRDGSLREALRVAGWHPSPAIQPSSTRLIDLRADEDALWSDLRKKWRQYVNRARTLGVTIEDADESALGDFYRIYADTATRAGFRIRTEATYRDIWAAFAPLGLVRLLVARLPDGQPAATLFLHACGNRVVEAYGGMTAAGAESRANYLIKWEAIRSSRERGARVYDLWGLPNRGIEHFKAGFGGREVRYIGAWDLVLDGFGRAAFRLAQQLRDFRVGRGHTRRRPKSGSGSMAGSGDAEGGG